MFNVLDTSSNSSKDEPVIARRAKVYRKREQCLQKYDDEEFFERFRLTKPTVLLLLEQIVHLLILPTNKDGCIQPINQLLLTLRFYATGNFLITVADFSGISKASASRLVRRVSFAIASLRAQYIKMYEDVRSMERAAEEFYRNARFPRVTGAIDCTLIKIESLGGNDAEIYHSRKNFFAYNLQTVCDAKMKIINIVARWPGSTHDQTVFNNSTMKREFDQGNYGKSILIGDSGYTLQYYLMTKLQETRTPAENLNDESIIRTRYVVERLYGVWKRRFPILSFGMRLKQSTTMAIIVATAVLHNIAIEMEDDVPDERLQNEADDNEVVNNIDILQINNTARHTRQLIINEHFANL